MSKKKPPKTEPDVERAEFWKSVDDAKAAVDSWPDWKRGGPIEAIGSLLDDHADEEQTTDEIDEELAASGIDLKAFLARCRPASVRVGERGRCPLCGAVIRWSRFTGSGMLVPLNAKPEPRVVLDDTGEFSRCVNTYVSHLSTCSPEPVRRPVAEWKTDDDVEWRLEAGKLHGVVIGSPDSEPSSWAIYHAAISSDEPIEGDGGACEGCASSVSAAKIAAEDALDELRSEGRAMTDELVEPRKAKS